MSTPQEGLSLLRAAVRDARREELQRVARASLVGADPFDRAARHHAVASTARVGPVVPAPSASTEEPLAAPEGETAVAMGLVERAQAGDAEAFGELYDRYVDQVFRYIAYRVGSTQ